MEKITENEKNRIINNFNNLSHYQRKTLYKLNSVLKEKSREQKVSISRIYDYKIVIKKEELDEFITLHNKKLIYYVNNRQIIIDWISGYDTQQMKQNMVVSNFSFSSKTREILVNAVYNENMEMVSLNL